MTTALSEAWRALDSTMVAPLDHTPESLLALESSDTGTWTPVVYFESVLRHSADAELPDNCQHSLITRLESTLADVTKDVRAVPSTHRQQLVDTPLTGPQRLSGRGAEHGAGEQGVPSEAP